MSAENAELASGLSAEETLLDSAAGEIQFCFDYTALELGGAYSYRQLLYDATYDREWDDSEFLGFIRVLRELMRTRDKKGYSRKLNKLLSAAKTYKNKVNAMWERVTFSHHGEIEHIKGFRDYDSFEAALDLIDKTFDFKWKSTYDELYALCEEKDAEEGRSTKEEAKKRFDENRAKRRAECAKTNTSEPLL